MSGGGGASSVVTSRRHEARITALQALFEIDAAEHSPDEVLPRYLGNPQMPPGARRFITNLVRGVLAERERLDAIIARTAPTWPVPQLPTVDRTVLRMALWELLVERDVPVRAVINEAVELAKRFGGANSGRFVNGVLGTVVAEHRPDARAGDAASGPGDANDASDAKETDAADDPAPGTEAPGPGAG
jgi:N utilization substance protein B